MNIHVDPVNSQKIYEFILGELSRDNKLPETYKFEDLVFNTKHLEQIYDIMLTNRARTRGTILMLEVTDKGDVTKITGNQAIKIAPQEIPKPRPAPKKLSKKTI
jgi:hypothetical protein